MTAVYDGPAAMRIGEADHPVRVRLAGHLDPIDGRYHWRGMVLEWTPETALRLPQPVSISIEGQTAEGQLTEVTPWGTHSISGVGAPPYLVDAGD
ncbi:MAG TPA: DUF4873 domain-containing protein [Mycobacterium sp.]|nr:DUF4873 domain-containing protein [Mycobacterium sp.]